MFTETTLLILLDAFRWDYLNPTDTPNLMSLADRGVYAHKLSPSFGFCERTEIFTGTRPNVNGNFTAVTYDKDYQPLSSEKWILKLLSPLAERLRGRYVNYAVGKYLGKKGINFPLYRIPLGIAHMLSLTEDRYPHDQEGTFLVESIFDIMLNKGKDFYYESFTALGWNNGDDNARLNKMVQKIEDRYDLYLLYIGSTDSIPHQFGTQSKERHKICRFVDERIGMTISHFQRAYEKVNLLIFGDHGMTDVVGTIDIASDIKKIDTQYGYINGRDYLMFLDSTMARFWFFDHESRLPIEDLLRKKPYLAHGSIVDSKLGQEYKAPVPSKKYGQLIWWANPGTIIFPDYFHTKKPVKAMHGYRPDHPTSKGMAIINGPDYGTYTIEEAELIDICPTLCKLLGLPFPEQNEGLSLV